MKWYTYVIVGIILITALILPGCGSSQSGNNQTTSTTSTTYSGQVIIINYSAKTIDFSGPEAWSSTPPREGNVFLLVSLHIENHGYDSFRATTNFFYIKIGDVKYTPTFMNGANNEITGGDVLDNTTLDGNLAFEVPVGTTDFDIFYKYASDFNMQWNKQ